jgi:hypothetical protein
MARKIDFVGITPQAGAPQQAQTQPAAPVDKGAYRSVGIGLKQQELAEVEALAQSYDLTRNAIMRLAVIRFIDQVKAGTLNIDDYKEPPTPQKQRLKHNI